MCFILNEARQAGRHMGQPLLLNPLISWFTVGLMISD
jgi:hypothetical protein